MTHYYFDPKTNTLHGPIDRMPPVWDYGFPPDGPSDSQLASAEADFDDAWKSFNAYLQTVPSHPHTLTGPSRVVPEGEIEWRYCNCKVGNDCPYRKGKWFSPCRVATPKITAQPDKPEDEALLDIAIRELKEERSRDKNNVNVWYNNGLSKAIIILESIQKVSPPPPSPQTGEKDMVGTMFLQQAAEDNAKKHYHNLSPYQAMVFGYIAGYKRRDAEPVKLQPPAAQSDQEAAEKYVSIEWYPDYVAKGETEQSKQSRKDFLAACTHVRSQQQREVVAKDAILDILDDVLDTEGSDELGYWIDRQSKEKAAEMIKKLYDPALFSGSQASNQSEEQPDAYWLYDNWCGIWGKAHALNVSDFQKLMREQYFLTPKTQQP